MFPVNGAPEDKLYSRDQYMSLSDEHKEALRQTHLARGHVHNGKTVNDGTKSNKAVIAALTARDDALVGGKRVQSSGDP
jgi:hypothetical protein